MSSSIGYSSQHLPISKSLKICNVDNNAAFYFSSKTQTMPVQSAVQCSAEPSSLFLYKPGPDQCLAQSSLQLGNYLRPSWKYRLGCFQSSKLHPMSFVLCKWIQYLRNILPIYPIAPLSAICGFSESKSHF